MQIVSRLDVLIGAKAFGKDVSDLVFARNEMDMDITSMNMFFNKS